MSRRASPYDLQVADPEERLQDPPDLELCEREAETEMLTDAEPDMPARGRVAALDIENPRRWEHAVIFGGVIHEHQHTLALVKAVAGEDDAPRDPAKREWRRHDEPERLVDRLLHELRLGTEASHLVGIEKEGDDARQRRRDNLGADKKERTPNRLDPASFPDGRAEP